MESMLPLGSTWWWLHAVILISRTPVLCIVSADKWQHPVLFFLHRSCFSRKDVRSTLGNSISLRSQRLDRIDCVPFAAADAAVASTSAAAAAALARSFMKSIDTAQGCDIYVVCSVAGRLFSRDVQAATMYCINISGSSATVECVLLLSLSWLCLVYRILILIGSLECSCVCSSRFNIGLTPPPAKSNGRSLLCTFRHFNRSTSPWHLWVANNVERTVNDFSVWL